MSDNHQMGRMMSRDETHAAVGHPTHMHGTADVHRLAQEQFGEKREAAADAQEGLTAALCQLTDAVRALTTQLRGPEPATVQTVVGESGLRYQHYTDERVSPAGH